MKGQIKGFIEFNLGLIQAVFWVFNGCRIYDRTSLAIPLCSSVSFEKLFLVVTAFNVSELHKGKKRYRLS